MRSVIQGQSVAYFEQNKRQSGARSLSRHTVTSCTWRFVDFISAIERDTDRRTGRARKRERERERENERKREREREREARFYTFSLSCRAMNRLTRQIKMSSFLKLVFVVNSKYIKHCIFLSNNNPIMKK
jgi:hypothetical protein